MQAGLACEFAVARERGSELQIRGPAAGCSCWNNQEGQASSKTTRGACLCEHWQLRSRPWKLAGQALCYCCSQPPNINRRRQS